MQCNTMEHYSTDTYSNMYESQKHVERKMPDTKKYILYHFIFLNFKTDQTTLQ